MMLFHRCHDSPASSLSLAHFQTSQGIIIVKFPFVIYFWDFVPLVREYRTENRLQNQKKLV